MLKGKGLVPLCLRTHLSRSLFAPLFYPLSSLAFFLGGSVLRLTAPVARDTSTPQAAVLQRQTLSPWQMCVNVTVQNTQQRKQNREPPPPK